MPNPTPPDHDRFMRRCLELAAEARRAGNTPVGSVVVRDGQIIGEAAETLPAGRSITGHAELLACQAALDRTGAGDLTGSTLYTTAEPCFMCSYAIRNLRVGLVVYALETPAIGGITSFHPILTDPALDSWRPAPRVLARTPRLYLYADESVSADERRTILAAETVYDDNGDYLRGVDDGAVIEWRVEGPDGSLEQRETTTKDGFSSNTLNTSARAGDAYRVHARLVRLVVGAAAFPLSGPETSDVVVVLPGKAARIDLALEKHRLPADGKSSARAVMTARDAAGNLVADGTFLLWGHSGSSAYIERDEWTTNGRASATFQSGIHAETQTVSVSIEGCRARAEVESLPLKIRLEIEGDAITLGSNDHRTVTATVADADGQPAADGAEILWLTRKGTIAGENTITGGVARATLSARGGSQTPGVGTVKAFVATSVGSTSHLWITPPGVLSARAVHPVLAGDRPPTEAEPGGRLHSPVEQLSDAFIDYPTWLETDLEIQGPPNAGTRVRVSRSDAGAELLKINGQSGSVVMVALDDRGRGVAKIESTGKLRPDEIMTIPIVIELADEPPPIREPGDIVAGPRQEGSITVNITLAPAKFIAQTQDYIAKLNWGPLTGDEDSLEAMADDTIAGLVPAAGVPTNILHPGKTLLKLWPAGEAPDLNAHGLGVFGMLAVIFETEESRRLAAAESTAAKPDPDGDAETPAAARGGEDDPPPAVESPPAEPPTPNAEEIVDRLIGMGYLKFTRPEHKDAARAELVRSIGRGYISCLPGGDDEPGALDHRNYGADNEFLAEGGVGDQILEMRAVLEAEGAALGDVKDIYPEEYGRYEVVINNQTHLIYDMNENPGANDWGLSFKRTLEITNALFQQAQSPERAFGVHGGNEARIVILTQAMYDLLMNSGIVWGRWEAPFPSSAITEKGDMYQ